MTDWDDNFETFLHQCEDLEVLLISCPVIPATSLVLPSMPNLKLIAVRGNAIFHVLATELPRLKTIRLLGFNQIQTGSHLLRHDNMHRLAKTLYFISKCDQKNALQDVIINNTSANVIAHLEWDEELLTLTQIREIVDGLYAKKVRVCDDRSRAINFPMRSSNVDLQM